MPEVMTPAQWPLNLGSERDWAFVAQPNQHLNGRSIPLNMGKVLGGGQVSTSCCGHEVTRMTGTTSLRHPAILRGGMNPSWRSIAVSKTGKERVTLCVGEQVAPFMWNPQRIPSLLHLPWLRPQTKWVFQVSKVRTEK